MSWFTDLFFGPEPPYTEAQKQEWSIAKAELDAELAKVEEKHKEPDPKAIPICGFKATDGSFHETKTGAHIRSQQHAKQIADRIAEEHKYKTLDQLCHVLRDGNYNTFPSDYRWLAAKVLANRDSIVRILDRYDNQT